MQPQVKSDYVSPYSRQAAEEAAAASQTTNVAGASANNGETNEFLTDVAGDVASHVIEESLTTENINAAKEHATQENIEAGASAAWAGLKWADKKADEHGVDKMAVA